MLPAFRQSSCPRLFLLVASFMEKSRTGGLIHGKSAHQYFPAHLLAKTLICTLGCQPCAGRGLENRHAQAGWLDIKMCSQAIRVSYRLKRWLSPFRSQRRCWCDSELLKGAWSVFRAPTSLDGSSLCNSSFVCFQKKPEKG